MFGWLNRRLEDRRERRLTRIINTLRRRGPLVEDDLVIITGIRKRRIVKDLDELSKRGDVVTRYGDSRIFIATSGRVRPWRRK